MAGDSTPSLGGIIMSIVFAVILVLCLAFWGPFIVAGVRDCYSSRHGGQGRGSAKFLRSNLPQPQGESANGSQAADEREPEMEKRVPSKVRTRTEHLRNYQAYNIREIEELQRQKQKGLGDSLSNPSQKQNTETAAEKQETAASPSDKQEIAAVKQEVAVHGHVPGSRRRSSLSGARRQLASLRRH